MKTAVEWLVQELIELKTSNLSISQCNSIRENIFEQAKQMEKEQIIEARFTAPILPDIDKSDYLKEAEKYYNETFKSE